MGCKKRNAERVFGPQLALTVKNRIQIFLCEALGLVRQPKVIKLLVDELFEVIDDCYRSHKAVKPGQVVLLVPKIGSGPRQHQTMAETPLVSVCVTLFNQEDIEWIAAGKPSTERRIKKMCRIVEEAYEQGGTLSTAQVAVLTGVAWSVVKRVLKKHRDQSDDILPLRGIVEDMGSAVSHKAMIIRLYLKGMSVTEIARKTDHAPSSIERYITRFNQIRELIRHMADEPNPFLISRIVQCSQRLVSAYLALLPDEEKHAGMTDHTK